MSDLSAHKHNTRIHYVHIFAFVLHVSAVPFDRHYKLGSRQILPAAPFMPSYVYVMIYRKLFNLKSTILFSCKS